MRAECSSTTRPTVARAYAEGIGRVGRKNTKNTIGVKINVDRDPTLDELETFVGTYGWYLIQFDVEPDAA